MIRSPPLRFLAVVLGGWAALRAAALAPLWPPLAAGDAASPPPAPPLAGRPAPAPAPWRPSAPIGRAPGLSAAALRANPAAPSAAPRPVPQRAAAAGIPPAEVAARAGPPPPPPRFPAPFPTPPGAAPPGRWSLSAWAFVRRGGGEPLAPAGLLGASQAGARLAYRLNRDRERPLALAARLSAPLGRTSGAEAALGLDWRPSRRLPLRLLAERRQKLGREGRSAFALALYGGVSDSPAGPLRLDGWVQAGLVGARSRDPFADGSLRLSLPAGGKVRVGAGAWAAAQPGLARLDLGPQAALRLPLAGRSATLAADWRLRVAGDARPGSGPTVTLGTDF